MKYLRIFVLPLVLIGLFGLVSTANFATAPVLAAEIDDTKICEREEFKDDPACNNSRDVQSYITPVLNAIFFAIGLISTGMIVYGGFKYATSAGDPSRITGARNTITYAIIGLIVSIMAFAIVNFVTSMFPTKGPAPDDASQEEQS